MQADFHYCAVKALAILAGFPEPEAETIAYASQYTDDSTEHKPVRVEGEHAAGLGVVDGHFDPVCSASSGLGYLRGLTPATQIKVYVAFHFVPRSALTVDRAFSWTVQPDGEIARARVKSLCFRLRRCAPGEDERTQTLMALGIALHSYADQWAHEWFSGRHSHENDVEHVAVDGNYVGDFRQTVDNLAPDIGHAELRSVPDTAKIAFSFSPAGSYQRVGRYNATHFLSAAEAIHEHLCIGAPDKPTPWLRIESRVRACLASRSDDATRWRMWSDLAHAPMNYAPLAWRGYSLSGGALEWDAWRHPADFLAPVYRATGAPEWFWWHAAAREHRAYVLGQVPGEV